MLRRKGSGEYGIWIVTAAILALAAVLDLKTGKVDNRLILAGLLTGGILQICSGFPTGIADAVMAAVLPVLCGWILFRIRAFGAGDIKLFCVIGLMNGCRMLAWTFVLSLVLAAGYGVIRLVRNREVKAAFHDLLSYGYDLFTGGRLIPYPQADRPQRRIRFCMVILPGYLLARILFC